MKLEFKKNKMLTKKSCKYLKEDIIENIDTFSFQVYLDHRAIQLKGDDYLTLKNFFDEQKVIAINDKLSQNRMIVSELTYRDELYLRNVEMCDDEINDILLKVDKSPQDYKNLESLSRTRSRFYSDHEKISKQISSLDFDFGEVDRMYKKRFSEDISLWK